MANVTITQLPFAQPLTGTELVPVVQNGQTVRTTTGAIGGGGTGGGVSSVDVSGGTTGLTTTGGPITSAGTITLGGTLAVGSGGTAATTAAGARGNLLPSYTGNAGYVLKVNSGATDVEWSATGGGGSGSVTQVATGTGLTGGPITTTGTISLANTAVTPATYSNATVAVDAQGRITSASSGTAPVTSVSGTANEISSSGGTTPVLSLPSALTFTGKTITGGSYSGGTINNASVGATTASTGRFTTLSATSGTVLASPTSNNDIVNKAYADAVASGLTFHQNCDFATADFLPDCTYNNGSSGVGATLTAISNGALLVDSSTIFSGNRILVKNQSSQLQNGIYTVTQVGTVSTPFILTRATDYNTPGTTYLNVDAGDFTLILNGATNANTSWVQTTLQPITIGVTSLVFVQFGAGTAIYSAGTGLSLSGTNQFSISNSGVTSGTYGSTSKAVQVAVNAQGQITGASEANIAIAASQVTSGTLPIAQGGTGQTTATNAINALLPSQSTNSGKFLTTDGSNTSWATGRLGTVESVSVVSANGLAGTVANPTSNPAITLSTSVNGLLKGNGTAISAAVSNTDYQAPITLTTTGTSGAATFNGTTLNIPQYTGGGGGGTPGGSNTQVQFNNSGSFGGSANLTWNGASLQVGGQGAVRFGDLDNSNWVSFRAPSTVGTNITWTLPATDGTNGQVLSTNSAGTLSWLTPGTVSTVSVVSANGLAGSVDTNTTTPAITLSTSVTGVLKGNGTAISAAAAGTDYLAPPSGTSILKGNSGGALANATAGTDYLAPPAGTSLLKGNSGGALANATAGTDYLAPPSGTSILKGNSGGALANAVAGTDYQAPITLTTTGTSGAATFVGNTLNIPQYTGGGGGSGTVTTVSVVSANGLAGTVANATTTPAITLSTSITGVLKGNGTAISAATSGTDYLAPPSGTSILKANSGGALANATAGTDYQSPITLTTTGSTGAASFNGTTLNIPQYSAGSGISTGKAIAIAIVFS